MKTAIAASEKPGKPLYVPLLEAAVRELDRVIMDEGPAIDADHPEDHGIDPEVARLVVALRRVTA